MTLKQTVEFRREAVRIATHDRCHQIGNGQTTSVVSEPVKAGFTLPSPLTG